MHCTRTTHAHTLYSICGAPRAPEVIWQHVWFVDLLRMLRLLHHSPPHSFLLGSHLLRLLYLLRLFRLLGLLGLLHFLRLHGLLRRRPRRQHLERRCH